MSKQAESIQYTIRGVPPEIDRALRRIASRRNVSLNRVIVDELAAITGQSAPKADFSDLVGRWEDDPGFDAVIASQRKIDWKKWR